MTHSMTTIVALSDYCQLTLKLSFWPARPLCNNFPGMDFPKWIGQNCSTPCIYGKPSNLSQDVCVCHKGYYGTNCSMVCPGGAQNICNKHGSCDISGVCACDINWAGDVNCTSCSDGWSGSDCSMVVTVPIRNGLVVGLSAISIRGHFSIFNGFSFVLHITGEYYLIISSELSINVQARFVSCFQQSSCINAIAIRISTHALVIHGPYSSKGSIVLWLDGTVIDIDVNPPSINVHGFTLVRVSVGLYEFKHHEVTIYVRVEGRYLNLRVKASDKLCNGSYGVLGACDKDIIDLLESYNPPTNCSEVMHNKTQHTHKSNNSGNRNASTAKIKELSVKVKVLECDSLFVYSYKEITEFRGATAGYAVFFNGTALVTTTVIYTAFSSNDITIDLMINIQRNGLIFSYSKEETFYLTSIDGTFSIYYGKHIYKTNITVSLNTWTQLSLVYRRSTGRLQVYYFLTEGIVQRIDLKISVNINLLEAGGYLALFGWFPPLVGASSSPPVISIGFIDQVRIWTRYFHPAIIQQIYKREVLVKTGALAHAWRFNEGEGVISMDAFGGVNFELTTTPWMVPAWKFSDATLKEPFFPAEPTYNFDNESLKNDSEMFCNRVFFTGPLYTACTKLGKGLLTYYYRSCLRRIASSGHLNSSMEVVVAFSDYCQTVLSLDIWPAKPLCNEFPGRDFPIWFGPKCDHKCEHGIKVVPEECTCHVGYWGNDCSKICPGGALSPCSNHGECNTQSGQCTCDVNWKGAECATCSNGWKGQDCSLAVVSIKTSLHISFAVSSYNGRYVTFDGVSYTFLAIGEFYVIYSPQHSLILQVRQVPTAVHSININAIALKVSNTVIAFHGPYVTGGQPFLWVDETFTPITGLTTRLGPANLDIRFWVESRDRYVLAWNDDVIIHIRVDGRYLSFKVDVKSQYCSMSIGLLGSCDNDTNNDLGYIPVENATQGDIDNILPNKFKSNEADSLFVLQHGFYKELRRPSGGIYALMFNSSGVSTGPLKKSIVTNIDLTIELLFKPFDHRGTLLSYAYLKTFAIVIDTTIQIYFDKQILDTRLTVHIGYWSHLSLVWYQETKILQVYLFDHTGVVTRVKYVLHANPFVCSGILTLGQWELSPGDTEERNKGAFVGVIDELRIWHRAFDPVLIQQNVKMNVQPADPALGGLWKCNEGEGDIIYDLVHEEHLYLPRSPWPRPVWVYSDADIKTNVTVTSLPYYDKNTTFHKQARSLCYELYFQSQVHSSCKPLKAEIEFYYKLCIQDIGTSGLLSSSLASVITFADHCEAALSLSFWPAQKLCNSIPGAVFPNWIGDKCDKACVFGRAKVDDRNICVCNHGYWGTDCSKACPGGILTTCGNHGYCNKQSGTCICDINWQGNRYCTSCSTGWFGRNCQFAVTEVRSSSRALQITSVGHLGYYKSFSGLCFSLRTHGEFYLLRSTVNNFAIQIRRGFCSGSLYSTTCTVAVAFIYKNVRIAIRAPLTTVSKTKIIFPLIWINGNPVRVDHFTRIDVHFYMIRISNIAYRISGPNGINFVITVGQSLGITLNCPKMFCRNSTGLLGSCSYKHLNDTSTVENTYKDLIASSAVLQRDTLFHYVYSCYLEHRIITGAGFCVRFTDSFVISKSLVIPRVDVLTLELLVRIRTYGGVILSFAKKNTFAVINEETLKIAYHNQVLDTRIALEVQQWNQISLVFYQSIGKLEVHCFDHVGQLKVRVFMLDTNVFASGGVLAFGKWLPSTERTQPPKSVFYGDIDEVKMWQRRTNPDIIKRTQNLNALPGIYPDLLHLWKMNEVQGAVIKDNAGSDDLYLKKFHEPERDFSDANVPFIDPERKPTRNEAEKEKLTNICKDTLLEGPLHENCVELGETLAQSYYNSCVYDTGATGDPESAIDSVIAFSDYCQQALNLKEWPARKLCNRFKRRRFPDWVGPLCEQKCKFGFSNISDVNPANSTCKCEDGYWGKNCSNLCDGGLFNVCNSKGTCDAATGQCKCFSKWNGTEQNNTITRKLPCSVCTQGWTGTDCSIAVQPPPECENTPQRMSINFGDPHFTTIDGVNYNFEVPGAYHLIKHELFSVQMLQVPCHNRVSCRRISEVAIKTVPFILSVKYTNRTTIETALFDQSGSKELVLTKSHQYKRLPSAKKIKPKYRWLTANILELYFSKNERMYILMHRGTLGIAFELPTENVRGTQGLCGLSNQWMTSLANHSVTNGTKFNQSFIDREFSTTQRVDVENVILTSAFARQKVTSSGFTMDLTNNYLSLVMDSNLPIMEEFTVEFWACLVNADSSVVKLCSSSKGNTTALNNKHALFSISSNTSLFALIYDKGIQILLNGKTINTSLAVFEGVWTHIAITWRSNDGRVNVITSKTGLNYSEDTFGVYIGEKFAPVSLVLGRLMDRYGHVVKEYTLRGTLDELRIWQYAKNKHDVLSLRDMKIGYHSGLLITLPLDEGYGSFALGKLYKPVNVSLTTLTEQPKSQLGKDITFRAHPSGVAPVWLASGIAVNPLADYKVHFGNESLGEQAVKICREWFYSDKIQGLQLCSTVLVVQAQFYYEACIADIADTGSLAHYKLSVSFFGLYCHRVLNIEACSLHGTFDAFPPCKTSNKEKSTDIPVIIITTATVLPLLLIIIIIVIMIIVCKRRKRKKKLSDETGEPKGLRSYTLSGEGVAFYEMEAIHHESDQDTDREDNTVNGLMEGSAIPSAPGQDHPKKEIHPSTKVLMYGNVGTDSESEQDESAQISPKKIKKISLSGDAPRRTSSDQDRKTELPRKGNAKEDGPNKALLLYESGSDDSNIAAKHNRSYRHSSSDSDSESKTTTASPSMKTFGRDR